MANKKHPHPEWAEQYQKGFSCQEIAQMFSVSRQAVWGWLVNNGYALRKKKILPFIIYREIKFTPSGNGYYRATGRKKHLSLHRYKWECEVGSIPVDYDIHHKDGDKTNNNLENLECLSKAEHTKNYSPHCNQNEHKCEKKTR